MIIVLVIVLGIGLTTAILPVNSLDQFDRIIDKAFGQSMTTLPSLEPPSVDIRNLLGPLSSIITVEYQSDSLVTIYAREDDLININGTMTPFWYAIDLVKDQGYNLSEVTTSGLGSEGNPTRFWAVLTKS